MANGQAMHRCHNPPEVRREPGRAPLPEDVHQGAVVPEDVVPRGIEPRPELLAERTVVGEDRAGVVKLIGGGDAEHVGWRLGR